MRRNDDFEVVTFVAIDWKPQSDVFPRTWDDNCPILTAANQNY